ncbi:MAG: ATP-binding protein [Lachnospiraceae bacterium]|nr:ATP-binding protein [Lachnospiraceae bacterium]
MGFMDEKLWTILKSKVEESDRDIRPDQQISSEYITGIKNICNFGVERAATIRDNFPMFTLHDETHICNVMRLMVELLGNATNDLSRDETAMLILAACCHDIGMSYSDKDKEELFADIDRLNKYLDNNKGEYVKAYAKGDDIPHMTDDMIQNYLRSIHHERIMELSYSLEWPSILEGKIDRQDFITVCQSHGRDISVLDVMEQTSTIDLRFCAILLRLSDILDFDTIRAPKAVYEYCGFEEKHSASAIKSKEEWDKHMSSHGFNFRNIPDRSYPYNLNYSAISKSMQVEQAVNSYLDWVDQELSSCNKLINRFTGKWQNFILPVKIKRSVKSEGYVSGQYRLTLDQDQIMELLVGKELYSDPSVFVRELIQNAIDSVRTREQLDRNLPSDWKAQINIRCWMDEEGYHWFRIEDNGIGMTEEIIMNFFLKIGRSYYNSDTFRQAKLRCKADPNYMPISRFGIGILSCFMGDEQTNRVEVSTKRFNESGTYYPALRLSMNGMNGYYYMANKEMNHIPGPMKGISTKEKEQYLKQAGTVIAVRTNLYQTGKYRSFKEIIDKYVVYPPVAIHYDGAEGSIDYPTELEFMEAIHNVAPSEDKNKNGIIEFKLSEEQLNQLYRERPEITFKTPPKILLNCIALDKFTKSPYLTGAILTAAAVGNHDSITIKIGERTENVKVKVETKIKKDEVFLIIYLDFSDEFKDSMRLIERKFENNRHVDDYEHKLRDFYSDDYLRYEILHAVIRGYNLDFDWDKHMKNRFNLTKNILDTTIIEVQQKINEIVGVDLPKPEEITRLKFFRQIKTQWNFLLSNLTEFNWYTKFFKNTRNNTELYSATAHNGILCGNADFFSISRSDSNNIGTILLLKDKYRPSVDVARDGIRMLTLEVFSDIEIIKKRIEAQGFNTSCDMANLDSANFSYISMYEYLNLLSERSDLIEQLAFKADNNWCYFDELQQKILKSEKVELQELPKLSNHSYWSSDKNKNLFAYICAAYLRKKCSLRVSFESYSTKIYVENKGDDILIDYFYIFPATFFLLPLKEDCPYLTSKATYDRYTCNARHPLSQFLLNNCQKLKQNVPGIFKEILRSLAEDEGTDLIANINEMLVHLRNLPGDLFSVPSTLILTENDLKS